MNQIKHLPTNHSSVTHSEEALFKSSPETANSPSTPTTPLTPNALPHKVFNWEVDQLDDKKKIANVIDDHLELKEIDRRLEKQNKEKECLAAEVDHFKEKLKRRNDFIDSLKEDKRYLKKTIRHFEDENREVKRESRQERKQMRSLQLKNDYLFRAKQDLKRKNQALTKEKQREKRRIFELNDLLDIERDENSKLDKQLEEFNEIHKAMATELINAKIQLIAQEGTQKKAEEEAKKQIAALMEQIQVMQNGAIGVEQQHEVKKEKEGFGYPDAKNMVEKSKIFSHSSQEIEGALKENNDNKNIRKCCKRQLDKKEATTPLKNSKRM